MTQPHPRPGQWCFDRRRRRFSAAALGTIALQSFSGCAAPIAATAAAQPWEARLQGSTLALLGEVHDNAEHHRRRAAKQRKDAPHRQRHPTVKIKYEIEVKREGVVLAVGPVGTKVGDSCAQFARNMAAPRNCEQKSADAYKEERAKHALHRINLPCR